MINFSKNYSLPDTICWNFLTLHRLSKALSKYREMMYACYLGVWTDNIKLTQKGLQKKSQAPNISLNDSTTNKQGVKWLQIPEFYDRISRGASCLSWFPPPFWTYKFDSGEQREKIQLEFLTPVGKIPTVFGVVQRLLAEALQEYF